MHVAGNQETHRMDIELGMTVHSSDGQDIGTLTGFVFQPATMSVTAVAIGAHTLAPHEAVAPLDALSAGPDGGLRLAYTAAHVEQLPHAGVDEQAGGLPLTFGPGLGTYFPLGSGNFGLGMGSAMPMIPAPIAPMAPTEAGDADTTQPSLTALRVGSPVMSKDGKTVGEIYRFTVDAASGRPAGVVVREGLFLTHDASLPPSLMSRVEQNALYLTVDEADVAG